MTDIIRGKQVNGASCLDIHQYGAVDVASARREVIDRPARPA